MLSTYEKSLDFDILQTCANYMPINCTVVLMLIVIYKLKMGDHCVCGGWGEEGVGGLMGQCNKMGLSLKNGLSLYFWPFFATCGVQQEQNRNQSTFIPQPVPCEGH